MGRYGIPITKELASKLHPYYRCPCGAEHGDMTDHPQGEKACPAHMGGQTGYKGGVPEYVAGKAFPEGFADFIDQQDAKGLPVTEEAREYVNRTMGRSAVEEIAKAQETLEGEYVAPEPKPKAKKVRKKK